MNTMNENEDVSRHEKAWNDPPLFSLDQMSRASNPNVVGAVHRRNRYPQQTQTPINPMNNPMVSTNNQNFGINQTQNPQNSGQPFQQQLQQMNATSNPTHFEQSLQQTNGSNNYETAFDVNAFIYCVHTLICSSNLPPELVHQWQTIQNHLYGVTLESQSKELFQSLLLSLQTKNFNNCRHYSNYLVNDRNETIRSIASTLTQIFRYFP